MQLLLIFVRELLPIAAKMLKQFDDEGACAGRRIKNLDALVDQVLAEMLLAQPVGRADHEAHDLARCIDDAEAIGGHRVIDLVEILVEALQEPLLFRVAGDHRCGRLDARIIGAERFQQFLLLAIAEQFLLQRVKRGGDIVLAVEVGILEHLGEDVFGQDMLDEHFPNVFFADRRVDGVASVLEEGVLGAREIAAGGAFFGDDVAQRCENLGEVERELLHRLAEVGDLGALVGEEPGEQREQRLDIVHRRFASPSAVLIEDGDTVIAEDDIVFRVALAEFGLDLAFEVVVFVLGFPIAKRDAKRVKQRSVGVDAVARLGDDLVLGDEHELVRLAPAAQQILERLAQHAFAAASGNCAQPVKFSPIFIDQLSAHAHPHLRRGHFGGGWHK